MITRVFLVISGAAWLAYGVLCLAQPEQLAAIAGVAAQTQSGLTELRAMYGGAQIAIGLALLHGALRPIASRWSLQLQTVIFLGIVPTRLVTAIVTADASSYTVGALVFELTFLMLSLLLLRRSART